MKIKPLDPFALFLVTWAAGLGLCFAFLGFGNIYLRLFGKPFLPTWQIVVFPILGLLVAVIALSFPVRNYLKQVRG